VVIGSTQRIDTVDRVRAAGRGVEVTRRPAGGGAVLVSARAQVWIDLWLPRGDPLWQDDVVRSARWVGEAWARGLGSLGAGDLDVGAEVPGTRNAKCRTEWSGVVCFAGVGPGEVTSEGAKIVGIAQRRDREGARFFTVAHMNWDPAGLVDLLRFEAQGPADLSAQLRDCALGLNEVLGTASAEEEDSETARAVEEAVTAQLP
jgi:lipoate---protein ligase